MKEKLARGILGFSIFLFAIASFFLWRKFEPFHTYYFLFAWWSAIGILDSRLYLSGGESLFLGDMADFLFFLVPFSAFLWFVFEAFNLRLENWYYAGVPWQAWIRWPGNFLAFGTVLPGIFLTANFLEHRGIFRKNEFSLFFSGALPKTVLGFCMAAGAVMLLLPLLFPKYFFPLVWGGFVLLLDPVNAQWGGRSLLQEWRQRNWNRTLQLLLAGLICGVLWELWNFWAGAKWVYAVPLPDFLLGNVKVFEMPLLGFLGFPPFALECFVMMEFARGLWERMSKPWRRIAALAAFLFSLAMCHLMDLYTVRSLKG